MNILKKGFTLVELILVIGIMSILVSISMPKVIGYLDKVKEKVCMINCNSLENSYELYLTTEDIVGNEYIFNHFYEEYSKDICPKGGIITYKNMSISCSIHNREEDDEDAGDDIPYL